jgi:hypothetical protein
MRNFLIVVLVLGAVGYYFDISPTDFLPTLPNSRPAAGERHASAATNPAPTAGTQASPAITPIASNSYGSLANRWQPDASPKKP